MNEIIQVSPWLIPAIAGGVGQAVGMLVGYNVIKYRMFAMEQREEACKRDRKDAEKSINGHLERIDDKLSDTASDVSYIKGRLNGGPA